MLGTTTRGGVHGRKVEEDGGSYEVPVQGVSSVIAVPSGGLRKGDRVQVFGTGGPLTTDFMGHGSDIMLHFNPRSQQRVVVRNSRFQLDSTDVGAITSTWGALPAQAWENTQLVQPL